MLLGGDAQDTGKLLYIALSFILIQKIPGIHESDPDKAIKLLNSTKGSLVPMPLDFLKNEPKLLPEFGTVEYIAPDTIFQ